MSATMKLRTAATLALALLSVSGAGFGQSTASPKEPRSDFDFLIGDWTYAAVDGNASMRAGQTYKFRRVAETPVITGDWTFDRSSPGGKPDFTRAKYYSGYDNMTASWSFYYVSERSAQSWPGTLRDGIWYFDHDFTVDGKKFHQRQWWEPVDANTLRRHIENQSADGSPPPGSSVVTLKRVQS